MGRYTDNYCAVCFRELIRPQNTCGASECLAEWKTWNAQRRFSRKNLAHLPPAERALVMAQGPTPEEEEAKQERLEQLESDLATHQQQEAGKGPGPNLRDLLNPDNLIKRKEKLNDG